MRTTRTTSRFLKDFKKVGFIPELIDVLHHLQNKKTLPAHYLNHPLKGNKDKIWDCHVKNDLVLLYRINDKDELELLHLGTHSEIFG